MPRALVTGVTGQDGSYLCELLLAKRYEVTGLVFEPDAALTDGVTAVPGDLADTASLRAAVERAEPDEVYHLAAQSFVGGSWAGAEATAEITGMGSLRMLEATREVAPRAKFFQASSAEVFGRPTVAPQNEGTPLHPHTPYGVAKAFAHHAAVAERESRGTYAVNGILYNHESPRRGEQFVTRKITRGVARISLGLQERISLGALDARRDWGFAGDYVEAMWRSLQAPEPRDYVIATGRTHSIRDLLREAFGCVGITDFQPYVVSDPALFRPAEPGQLVGDPSRARAELGWWATVDFPTLVSDMVAADLAREAALA